MKSNITQFSRSILSVALAACLLLISGVASPTAEAVTQIKLTDLSADLCPADVGAGTVTSGGPTLRSANCFLITGTTKNPSNRPVLDADIFGRVYDTNGNPVMENRTRLGSIPEVSPGVGTFELRISVPEGLKPPLKLEQFKASGFATKVR
ncbi:MAG: hypothetical protein ACFCU8_10235 [Thermosynechococcaceae cyanobacterium]